MTKWRRMTVEDEKKFHIVTQVYKEKNCLAKKNSRVNNIQNKK